VDYGAPELISDSALEGELLGGISIKIHLLEMSPVVPDVYDVHVNDQFHSK
jgi:hypothetical protein